MNKDFLLRFHYQCKDYSRQRVHYQKSEHLTVSSLMHIGYSPHTVQNTTMPTRVRQLEYVICYSRSKENFTWKNTYMHPPPPAPLP